MQVPAEAKQLTSSITTNITIPLITIISSRQFSPLIFDISSAGTLIFLALSGLRANAIEDTSFADYRYYDAMPRSASATGVRDV